MVKCADGEFCNVKKHTSRWGCCSNHGGKSKCSKNFPIMCARDDCGAYGRDFCCDSRERCITIYGGVRKCEKTSKFDFK